MEQGKDFHNLQNEVIIHFEQMALQWTAGVSGRKLKELILWLIVFWFANTFSLKGESRNVFEQKNNRSQQVAQINAKEYGKKSCRCCVASGIASDLVAQCQAQNDAVEVTSFV